MRPLQWLARVLHAARITINFGQLIGLALAILVFVGVLFPALGYADRIIVGLLVLIAGATANITATWEWD